MKQYSQTLRRMAVGAALMGGLVAAHAGSFACLTGSVSGDTDANGCTTLGESELSWSLVGNVLTISNIADTSSSMFISGISFATSAGQTVALATSQMDGVSFVEGGVGANLPASLGWTINYEATAAKKPKGSDVDAGESISFNVSGVSLADVSSGSFKFGVHIQALPGDRSEKLIAASVPEPESYAMGVAGLMVVGGLLRRRGIKRA